MKKQSSSLAPIWQLHLGVLLLGGAGLFAKFIALPALDIIIYRSLFSAIFLFFVLKLTRTSIKLNSQKDYYIVIALGLLAGIHWLTYFMSIQKTSVAVAMIALFTYPVFIVILEPLLHQRRPQLKDLLLSLIVLFGISLLFPNLWQSSNSILDTKGELFTSDYLLGLILGVVSALCFALRNIGISKYFNQYSGAQSMFYQLLVSTLIFLPFLGSMPEELIFDDIGLLILLAILFTSAPHVLLANALAKISAKTVGIISFLQPLYGTLLAIILLSEIPTLTTLIGGTIILLAALYESITAYGKQNTNDVAQHSQK